MNGRNPWVSPPDHGPASSLTSGNRREKSGRCTRRFWPAVEKIRSNRKLSNTYLGAELDEDSRIRCDFNLAGTETGRLSSSASDLGRGTNLENVPEGICREVLVADHEHTMYSFDLAGADWVITAYASGDPNMISILERGLSPHVGTCSLLFNIPLDKVVKDNNRQAPYGRAKACNHALNYKMGHVTMSHVTNLPVSETKRLREQYLHAYSGLLRWWDEIEETLRKSRVVMNLIGRRREFFSAWGESLFKEAIAHVPQSTVADLCCAVMNRVARRYPVLNQVHDSFMIQVPNHIKSDDVFEFVRECGKHPLEARGRTFNVGWEGSYGPNWGQLRSVGRII